MALLAVALKVLLGLVVAVVAVAGIAYATDYGMEATVVSKDCGAGGDGGNPIPLSDPSVTVKTRIGELRHTQSIPATECQAIQPGNFVVYHIKSGRTSLFETEGGKCIYDSIGGVGGCPT
jgi:hypothetical protein